MWWHFETATTLALSKPDTSAAWSAPTQSFWHLPRALGRSGTEAVPEVGEWVWIWADKLRIGVVLMIQDTRVLVALGTGTLREPPRACIEPMTRTGKRLGLMKATYFYPATIRALEVSAIDRRCGRGPAEIFNEIRAFLPDS